LAVTYTPDSTSSAIYVTTTAMVQQVVTSTSNFTPVVTVQPSASSITTAQQLVVAVTVSTASGKPAPTGMVTLTSGSYAPPPVNLSGGKASFNISPQELPTGIDTLTVSYAPDAASSSAYNSATGMAQVTVSLPAKIAPTVQVTPSATTITNAQGLSVAIALQGGAGNPAPTGSVTLSGGGFTAANLPLTNSTVSVVIPYGILSPGNDTLTATYTPDSVSAYTYTTATGTAVVTVTSIPPSTPAITITANPPSPNTAESVAVTVSLSGTPAPTGTLILSSGTSYTSTAATLAAGSASFTIPAGTLPPGSDTLTAAYTPDGPGAKVYNPTTGTATLSVAPGGSFTVSNSETSLTISPGGTSGNTVTISVTPLSGFVGQINLACAVTTSLSIYTDAVTCTLGSGGTTKTSLALNGSPATTTLTVLSTAAGGAGTAAILSHLLGGGAALAGLLFFGMPARRRGWQALLGVVLLTTFSMVLGGCGSSSGGSTNNSANPGTTAGPYIVTVTGTDAATGTLTSVNTVNVIVK
jgi:hypothetical protein